MSSYAHFRCKVSVARSHTFIWLQVQVIGYIYYCFILIETPPHFIKNNLVCINYQLRFPGRNFYFPRLCKMRKEMRWRVCELNLSRPCLSNVWTTTCICVLDAEAQFLPRDFSVFLSQKNIVYIQNKTWGNSMMLTGRTRIASSPYRLGVLKCVTNSKTNWLSGDFPRSV